MGTNSEHLAARTGDSLVPRNVKMPPWLWRPLRQLLALSEPITAADLAEAYRTGPRRHVVRPRVAARQGVLRACSLFAHVARPLRHLPLGSWKGSRPAGPPVLALSGLQLPEQRISRAGPAGCRRTSVPWAARA